jgi:hypothetical protein
LALPNTVEMKLDASVMGEARDMQRILVNANRLSRFHRNLRCTRLVRRVTPLIVVLLSAVITVRAAAPRIIIIYGSLVPRKIMMTQWEENHRFMLAITETAGIDPKDLSRRPYVELAFFWGPDWVKYVSEGRSLDALTAVQANQHGRFYPAFYGAPPIVELDRGNYRKIQPEGLKILATIGVPTQIAEEKWPHSRWLVPAALLLLLLLTVTLVTKKWWLPKVNIKSRLRIVRGGVVFRFLQRS